MDKILFKYDFKKNLILSDIDFTIDKKLESELWNSVFKNQINYFQSQIKENSSTLSTSNSPAVSSGISSSSNKNKNLLAQKKLEAQANLSIFLEAARGFYTKLLEDLAIKYDLNQIKQNGTSINVSFYQRLPNLFEQHQSNESKLESSKEKQVLYICQHTLTHLGDIARYQTQFQEAKNYYLHAIKLVPYLGHPYNQLGILFETSRTNQLSTVFYYIRSIAAKYTFPLASTNLENFFHKLIDTPLTRYDSSKVVKLAHKDLLNLFLQLNALIHSCLFGKNSKIQNTYSGKLNSFFELFKTSFQSFMQPPWQLDKIDSVQFCQIVSIVLFHLSQQSSAANDPKLKDQVDLALNVAQNLFVYFLEQFIQVFNESTDLSNTQMCDTVLPSIYLCFSFLEHYKNAFLINENKQWCSGDSAKIFNQVQATVKFLNCLNKNLKIQKELSNFNSSKYSDYPLNEDRMLDSYLPFKEAHANFSFKKYINKSQQLTEEQEKILRYERILAFIERIVNKPDCYLKINNETEIKFSVNPSCPGWTQPILSSPGQQQPIRKRRQNVAISSMTNESSVKENLALPKPIGFSNQPVKLQNFPQAQGSNISFGAQARFQANQLNWQSNPPAQVDLQQQGGIYFPSASTRQFNQPTSQIQQNFSNFNGFPSFLPNNTMEKSTSDQINQLNAKFNLLKQQQQVSSQDPIKFLMNQQNNNNNSTFIAPKFGSENLELGNNLGETNNITNLLQKLLTNSSKPNDATRLTPEKTIEYNLHMINYMQQAGSFNNDANSSSQQSNPHSIWSYPSLSDRQNQN